jgi:catechol 2,3-dioxygenase-like lactoylglutathione lyase family enzyme
VKGATVTLDRCSIICFAATKQSEQARKFYQDVLDLRLIEDTPVALVFDANGTMLRIQKIQDHRPVQHTVLGWQVGDIRSAVDNLSSKGIRFERYDGLPQDDRAIWQTPDNALVAWFRDPDGNLLSLTQL